MARTPDKALGSGNAPPLARPPNIRELLGQRQQGQQKISNFARYRQLVYPTSSLIRFLLFELATMLLLPMPGGLGLMLRRKLLKPFFGSIGNNVIIGRNCVFRYPQHIFIGDWVVIDDNCLLDARGAGEEGLRLSQGVLLSRGVQVKSRGGGVHIGRDVNVGDGTQINSEAGIWIGDGAGISGACHVAGGTFSMGEFNRPATQRTSTSAGPIRIEPGVWIAIGVMVLDGVSIGRDSIIAAGSVVTRSVPARCIAEGNPARKVFDIR